MGKKRKIGLGSITLQLEYYLSNENLEGDLFLQQKCMYTPLPAWKLKLFCSFPLIQEMINKSRFVQKPKSLALVVVDNKRKKNKKSKPKLEKQKIETDSKYIQEVLLVLRRAVKRSPYLSVFMCNKIWYVGRGRIPSDIFADKNKIDMNKNVVPTNNILKCVLTKVNTQINANDGKRLARIVRRYVEGFVSVDHAAYDFTTNEIIIRLSSEKMVDKFFMMQNYCTQKLPHPLLVGCNFLKV